METIFDCKFKPDDPNLLATASFDGTIKIWDTNTLTAVYTSPGNEGVVYSLSWAPGRGTVTQENSGSAFMDGAMLFVLSGHVSLSDFRCVF